MAAQSWERCVYLIKADSYRVDGRVGARAFLANLVHLPSSRVLLVYRLGHWSMVGRERLGVRLLCRLLYGRWSARYGLEIPFATDIGPGLKIAHLAGGVIVNSGSRIGAAVTLTPGVVIGNNAGRSGPASIGDRVVIHVGAKVIGDIEVGSDSQIGVNAVVNRDMPPGSVIAGMPARVIEGHVPFTGQYIDFESALGPVPPR